MATGTDFGMAAGLAAGITGSGMGVSLLGVGTGVSLLGGRMGVSFLGGGGGIAGWAAVLTAVLLIIGVCWPSTCERGWIACGRVAGVGVAGDGDEGVSRAAMANGGGGEGET
jgi:hypothetical protein